MDRLTGELRRWAERPGALSPGEARSRVLARLPRRRRRPAWRLVTGAAALAATALAVALLVDRPGEPPAEPAAAAATAPPTIVHQLSTGTRLYIVVRPDAGRTTANEEC